MFEAARSRLSGLIVHYIGNKLKDDELVLSQDESALDEPTRRIVWDYVFSAFKAPDFFQFSHPVDLEMNNVYSSLKQFFKEPGQLVKHSSDLARLLHEVSQHPNVRSGELMVIYFEQLAFGEIAAPAIGLFKSEKKQPFLFTETQDEVIDLYSYQGISPSKVDKAALIFNTDAEEGYQVLSIDNINKGEDAKFWFENFLKIKSRNTEFSRTSAVIDLTKSFIDQDFGEEAEVEKTRSIDLLNKSKEFFKENDHFDYDRFSEQVFEDEAIGNRFREYTRSRDTYDLDVEESFNISPEAVKKKQRIFKSVLKLDKNFHVYIHGNRDMIEKGTDESGRKYYKLFFEEET